MHLLAGPGVARGRRAGQARARPERSGLAAAAWLALLAGLLGCSGLSGLKPKSDDLAAVVERFHHDLRWKYNQDAAARVLPEYAVGFRERIEELGDDWNITAWEIRRVEPSPDGRRVAVRVSLSYYLMPSNVVEDVRIDEVWQLVGDAWMLTAWSGGPLDIPPRPPAEAPDDEPRPAPAQTVRDLPEDQGDD